MTKADFSETVDLQAAGAPEHDRRPSPAHSNRSPQATMLTLTGLGTTLFGLALSIAPLLSWKASKIMVGLDSLGVHGGALAVGGMLLVGLGLIRRGQVNATAALSESNADSEIVEQMAQDVVRMGNAMDHMHRVVGAMQAQLLGLKNEIVASIPPPPPPPVSEVSHGGNEDAIFRLAATLDKVGAKLEERLKSQFAELQGNIASVESSVREGIDEAQRTAAVAPEVHAAPEAYAAPEAPTPTADMYAPEAPPQVVQHHVQEAPVAPAAPPAYQQPPLPVAPVEPENSLGVLDTLHDEVVGAPPEATVIDFESVRLEDADAALPSAAPGQGVWEEELNMVETGDPDADARLRSALEDMRRTGEHPQGNSGYTG